MYEDDAFGAVPMFCRESGIRAEYRKMIETAWIRIAFFPELGPAIVPILHREHSKMQMNEDRGSGARRSGDPDIPLLPDGLVGEAAV